MTADEAVCSGYPRLSLRDAIYSRLTPVPRTLPGTRFQNPLNDDSLQSPGLG